MPTKQKEVAGPVLSAVRHVDSETSSKWEMVWVALLSDPCTIYHVIKIIIYELAAPLINLFPYSLFNVDVIYLQ